MRRKEARSPWVLSRGLPGSLQLVPVTRIETTRRTSGEVVEIQGGKISSKIYTNGWNNAMKKRFTNTAIPAFSGAECWFQHYHIIQAIVKSNGWSEVTAALQLFAHLQGGGP